MVVLKILLSLRHNNKQIEIMTNLDFTDALKNDNKNITFTDFNGKKYIHIILKVGKLQVTLFDTFLNKKYNLSFRNHNNYPQYTIN